MTLSRPSVCSPVSWRAAVPRLLLALLVLQALAACVSQTTESPVQRGARSEALPDAGAESDQRRRARIRLELAGGYYEQGNYNVALQEAKQSLAIDPDYAAGYGLLGLIYMDLKDARSAEENFQRALRLTPDDSNLNNNYGWFLCQSGRHQQGIEHFNRALQNPLYATPSKPLHNAGICAMRMGDERQAEQYFQRAFQVDPNNPVAMYNLGEIHLKRNEIDKARFYASRLTTAYEPSAQTLWLALRAERKGGNKDAEASLATQLRRRFPQSPEAQMLANEKYGD